MKKRIRLAAVLMTAFMVLNLAACGGAGGNAGTSGGGNTSSTSKDSAPSGGGSSDAQVTLRIATFVPEVDSLGTIMQEGANRIESLSGGQIKCEVYYSGNLLGFGDMYNGVSEGIADIGIVGMSVMDSTTKLNQIFSTLHKHIPADNLTIEKCYWEFLDAVPEVQEELAANNLERIGMRVFPGSDTVIASTKEINSVADLKGMTLQSSQSLPGKVFENLGTSSVAMESTDYYNSFDRGIIDGIYDVWSSFYAQKTMEVAKYYTALGEGGISAGTIAIVMNKSTLDGLTEEQQGWVRQAFREASEANLPAFESDLDNAKKYAEENNIPVKVLSDADLEPLYAEIDKVMESWFSEIEATYPNVRDYYKTLEDIFAKNL